jgi:hypothetical protein
MTKPTFSFGYAAADAFTSDSKFIQPYDPQSVKGLKMPRDSTVWNTMFFIGLGLGFVLRGVFPKDKRHKK